MLIGPFTPEQWETLKMLKASIAWMKSVNYLAYKAAIEKETNIMKLIIAA